MPTETPVKTPEKVEPRIAPIPGPDPDRTVDPDTLCPDQQRRVVREVGPI